jgi:hypothetical protein
VGVIDAADPTMRPVPGPLLFARYAYPPNERGYCGPADHRTLLEYGAAGVADPGIADLARRFTGAWPYLTLIAAEAGIADPLDRRVVEAYWLGNRLLDRIDATALGNSLRDRFFPRIALSARSHLAEVIPAGALPHHSFHVFEVYPWVGLLGGDHGDQPLQILDRCRIRWGRVVATTGDRVVVKSRPLQYAAGRLSLAEEIEETAVVALDGYGFVGGLETGDVVALHWDWVCDRLDRRQTDNLIRYTNHHLEITNRRLSHPGAAMTLG